MFAVAPSVTHADGDRYPLPDASSEIQLDVRAISADGDFLPPRSVEQSPHPGGDERNRNTSRYKKVTGNTEYIAVYCDVKYGEVEKLV